MLMSILQKYVANSKHFIFSLARNITIKLSIDIWAHERLNFSFKPGIDFKSSVVIIRIAHSVHDCECTSKCTLKLNAYKLFRLCINIINCLTYKTIDVAAHNAFATWSYG